MTAPQSRFNASYQKDALLILKNSGAITASSALDATGGSAAPIVDVGTGFMEGNVYIDVTALLATAGNGIEIYVQGTESDATFGTDTNIEELTVLPLIGDVAARRTDANKSDDVVTTGRGRYILPIRNERNGRIFRYLRIYTLVVSSGTITYSAQLVPRTGQ